MIVAVDPEKFRDFNGIWTLDLCVTPLVLYQLSYEDPTLGPAGVNYQNFYKCNLQVQLSFSDSKTIATLVNHTLTGKRNKTQ